MCEGAHIERPPGASSAVAMDPESCGLMSDSRPGKHVLLHGNRER